jgi:hypothetical protein
LFGGKLSPLAYVPKCTQCSTKLERISSEEFEQQSSRFSPEK